MSENKKVFITPKGRKYHFYTSCNYIKGRQYQKISFAQAKKLTKGLCSSCQHLLEKNGDKFDDESVEKEEEEKEKEENNKINININKEINNKNKISKKLNNKKKEEFKENNISSSSSSSDSNSFEVEKEKITKENIMNFFNSNFDDISGIKQNTHYNDNSKADIDILKDKIDINNKNKFDINNNNKNEEEEEDEEDEKKENINIINNNNNINNNKEEYFNNNEKNNSIENMNKLKYNLDPNLPKKDLNWKGRDFFLLEETNKSSQLLFLQEIEPIPNPHDKNRLILTEKNDKNKESSISKGNFKFRFEITPYKELKEQLKISVGFEIDYLEEEDTISKKENMKMNLSYETLILIKHFLINKKTNKIHVMINISNGKFFVIGNDELEKRSQNIFLNSKNSEILFLKNFRGIKLEYIKDVRPVFEYDIKYLKLVNIDVGRNILNEYSKFGKNK
jgi:hypothetical protein